MTPNLKRLASFHTRLRPDSNTAIVEWRDLHPPFSMIRACQGTMEKACHVDVFVQPGADTPQPQKLLVN